MNVGGAMQTATCTPTSSRCGPHRYVFAHFCLFFGTRQPDLQLKINLKLTMVDFNEPMWQAKVLKCVTSNECQGIGKTVHGLLALKSRGEEYHKREYRALLGDVPARHIHAALVRAYLHLHIATPCVTNPLSLHAKLLAP